LAAPTAIEIVGAAMLRQGGVSELFWAAFKQSRNPMVLLDHRRRIVEANARASVQRRLDDAR
jgi:hypothetical protein